MILLQVKKLIKFRCLKWRKMMISQVLVLDIFHSSRYDGNSTIAIGLVPETQERWQRRSGLEL